jgi:hypothetical protein
MPSAHMPTTFASSVPLMSHATSRASWHAATYDARFQSRWAAVGFRQLTVK